MTFRTRGTIRNRRLVTGFCVHVHDEQEAQHFNACSQHTDDRGGGLSGCPDAPRRPCPDATLSAPGRPDRRSPKWDQRQEHQDPGLRLQPSGGNPHPSDCGHHRPPGRERGDEPVHAGPRLPWWDAPHGCQPWLRPHSGNSPQNQILGFRPRRAGRSATLRAMTADLTRVRGGTFLLRCTGRILSWGPDGSRWLSILSFLAASADLAHTGSLTGLAAGHFSLFLVPAGHTLSNRGPADLPLGTRTHISARHAELKAQACFLLLLSTGALISVLGLKKKKKKKSGAATVEIKSKLAATPLIIGLPSG